MSSFLHRLVKNRLTLPFTPFYQCYPYKDGISINSADARGCVDTDLGFFYNRIPKAANSTITTTLAKLKFGDDFPPVKSKKIFKHPSQLTQKEVAAVNSLFRFVVVRNPYVRTLSAYLDKVERRFAEGKNDISSFPEFLEALTAGKLYSNAHWAPQSSLLLLPFKEFDFVGKVESLEDDMVYIRARLLNQKAPDNPAQVEQTREPEKLKAYYDKTSIPTSAKEKLKVYYDEPSIQIVQDLFTQDFELFGYSPEFPA